MLLENSYGTTCSIILRKGPLFHICSRFKKSGSAGILFKIFCQWRESGAIFSWCWSFWMAFKWQFHSKLFPLQSAPTWFAFSSWQVRCRAIFFLTWNIKLEDCNILSFWMHKSRSLHFVTTENVFSFILLSGGWVTFSLKRLKVALRVTIADPNHLPISEHV